MFISEKLFVKNKKLRPISTIKEIDLSDEKNHKARCELGAKYNNGLKCLDYLKQNKMDDLMKSVLIAITTYLLENLPFNKQVMYVRFLHPDYPLGEDHKSVDAAGRLSVVLWDCLEEKTIDLFYLQPLSTKCDFIDIIKKEFQEFRLEPESFSEGEGSSTASKHPASKPSYWRRCLSSVNVGYKRNEK